MKNVKNHPSVNCESSLLAHSTQGGMISLASLPSGFCVNATKRLRVARNSRIPPMMVVFEHYSFHQLEIGGIPLFKKKFQA